MRERGSFTVVNKECFALSYLLFIIQLGLSLLGRTVRFVTRICPWFTRTLGSHSGPVLEEAFGLCRGSKDSFERVASFSEWLIALQFP